jgi:signal peptidase II
MKGRIYFFFIAFFVLVFDQLLKFLVISKLTPLRSIPVINNFFYISYVKNTGAAFGLFAGQMIFLIITGLAVCAVVIYFHFKVPLSSHFTRSSLALILGGSIGNLVDRIFRGYVVDFIDFRFWPAFNLADIAVNLGIFLIIVIQLFGKEDI